MHIEFLLEEDSTGAALEVLLPKIIGQRATYIFHVYQGKPDLLGNLGARLAGYRQWIPDDWRIVVLIDQDDDDCRALKGRMEAIAQQVGLTTKTAARPGASFKVVNRLAIEELEAWFFGDVQALCAAYPGVPRTLGNRAKFRNPDAIKGGTWEAMEKVLQKAGYYRAGMPKIECASRIAQQMDPQRNVSRSFRLFRDTLRAVVR
jgi:hypothetical protein